MAKLLDGTRIYGTANVDTRVNIGANVFTNTSALSIGPFGTTNGTLITTTTLDVGNTTANAALDYNIIYVANSTSRANLTPTTLSIGSITVNSALANLQALNVVNQTNTGTLHVTTSANVGTAFTVNSTVVSSTVNSNFDSGTLFIDSVNNRVYVNATATVTSATFEVTGAQGATPTISAVVGTNSLRVFPNLGAGAYNNLTAAGDIGLIFSNGTMGFGNLVIGGHSSANFGFKLNTSANSITIAGNTVNVTTALTIGSASLTSALANLQALNVVNQTNTATLYVTTSANVGTALTVNSTAINAAVNTSIRAIIANGSIGSSGQVLTSNSTGIYWSTVSGGSTPGGSDTQIQFNDGGSSLNGTAGFTFNKVTNNVAVGNTITVGTTSTVNGSLANLQALNVVNQTNTGTLFVTTSANVSSAFLANSTGAYHTGTINATSHTVGTTTVVNSTAISLGPFGVTNGALITTTTLDIGNTTANAALDYNIIYVANSTSRANLTPTTLAIGSITVNSALANLQALNVVNQTNTSTIYVTTSANVGTSLTVNSTSINAAVNTSIRAIIANGSIGSSGQVLTSNATGIYWSTVSGGSISNYSANIGNGSATSITVTHNLHKENVIATVRENSSGYYVYPDIKYATTNTTVLEFVDAPTTDQYKVIVIGV